MSDSAILQLSKANVSAGGSIHIHHTVVNTVLISSPSCQYDSTAGTRPSVAEKQSELMGQETRAHGEEPSEDLRIITDKVVEVLGQVFSLFNAHWENLRLPSRLAIGSADWRKLAIRIRSQPVNFMMTIRNSLATAHEGHTLCMRGLKYTNILMGGEEDHYPVQAKEEYTKESIAEVKKTAESLCKSTADMHTEFRELRTDVFDIHHQVTGVTGKGKREQPAILTWLARSLSKDVRTCEAGLYTISREIEEIEQHLNIITRWWLKIWNQEQYLLRSSESPLLDKQNIITLEEIRDSFVAMGSHFDNYLDKVYQVYDRNIPKLRHDSKRLLEEAPFRGKRLELRQEGYLITPHSQEIISD